MIAVVPDLTGRQREVLDAIGSRDAMSPEYVARAAGELEELPTPEAIASLVDAGLVEWCYRDRLVRLTPVGREALDGPPAARGGWTVDGGTYRRVGVSDTGRSYGVFVALEGTGDEPWLAYGVADPVGLTISRVQPPVTHSTTHRSAVAALDVLDTFIAGLSS